MYFFILSINTLRLAKMLCEPLAFQEKNQEMQ